MTFGCFGFPCPTKTFLLFLFKVMFDSVGSLDADSLGQPTNTAHLPSQDARNICLIGLPYCSTDHSWNKQDWQDDNEFAYRYLGVGKSSANCLERAAEWHGFCRNSPQQPVQALYTPTGESSVFPLPDEQERDESSGTVPVVERAGTARPGGPARRRRR